MLYQPLAADHLAASIRMIGPVTVTQLVVGALIAAPIIAIGLWALLGDRKARRAPVEVQEASVKEVFNKRQAGSLRPSVGINLDGVSLPHERIKEIAADYGYEFDRVVKTRNSNSMRFNLKGSSQ